MSFDNNMYSVDDLYSPSKWTKRYESSEECLEDHVKIITKKSEFVRENLSGDLDIAYGPTPMQKYDLIGTDLPDSSPIIFYIHGGYWQEESIGRTNASFIATVFHKHGIKAFIIGYELCPNVEFEEIVLQTQTAFRTCLDYAINKGSSGIFLMGHSAGAHLVAHFFNGFTETLLPEEIQLIKSAFLIGGIYDIEPLLYTSYNDPLKLTQITAKKFSPLQQDFSACNTNFFVVVGRNDAPAFVTQAEIFERMLSFQNITSKLFILENIDHFNLIEKITEKNFQLTELIVEIVEDVRS